MQQHVNELGGHGGNQMQKQAKKGGGHTCKNRPDTGKKKQMVQRTKGALHKLQKKKNCTNKCICTLPPSALLKGGSARRRTQLTKGVRGTSKELWANAHVPKRRSAQKHREKTSAAQKTVGTVLSQTMRHEDTSGQAPNN